MNQAFIPWYLKCQCIDSTCNSNNLYHLDCYRHFHGARFALHGHNPFQTFFIFDREKSKFEMILFLYPITFCGHNQRKLFFYKINLLQTVIFKKWQCNYELHLPLARQRFTHKRTFNQCKVQTWEVHHILRILFFFLFEPTELTQSSRYFIEEEERFCQIVQRSELFMSTKHQGISFFMVLSENPH